MATRCLSTIVVVAVLMGGCGRLGAGGAIVASKPFSVGEPSAYQSRGVYEAYRASHGVFIYSDGNMVVALAAENPPTGQPVTYDRASGNLKSIRDGVRWTKEGLPLNAEPGQVALERCRLEMKNGQLYVYPSTRYRFEDNKWSSMYSLHRLSG